MRLAIAILCALLFIPLLGIGVNCSSGTEPETVIVPVGEPSFDGSDPYDDDSSASCGTSTDAAGVTLTGGDENGESMVLLVFQGTHDVWLIYVSLTEFRSLQAQLERLYNEDYFSELDHADVDRLHADLCASPDRRSAQAQELHDIFQQVLGANRLSDLEQDVCE